jgi:hypothetical protein
MSIYEGLRWRASQEKSPAPGQLSAEVFTTEGTEEHRVDTDGEETSEMD